jgi:2-oxoisovalerate dehydrogenase E1 component
LEKHFFGAPGLSVAAVNAVFDPAILLERIYSNLRGPCLLVENKLLYTVLARRLAADGRVWQENSKTFPTLRLDGDTAAQLTIVAYGGMTEEVEAAVKQAFLEDEVLAEVLVPTMIYPLDLEPILESVSKTRRLLVVEEGQGFAGFGAEVLASCSERLRGALLATARVCAAAHPIPCSRELEKLALPDASAVLNEIRKLTSQ